MEAALPNSSVWTQHTPTDKYTLLPELPQPTALRELIEDQNCMARAGVRATPRGSPGIA